jgi:inward rectifier potassium channel
MYARLGLRAGWMKDLYHYLLVLPWSAFIAGFSLVYLGLNLIFAALYLLGDGAVANARPGMFADAFFFSVETLSTIGYGQMSPATFYGNAVMTVEAATGVMLVAVAAGLMFARFSRPTAWVVFSKVAVVGPFNGVPTLSLRLANERRNQILEAQVSLTLVRDEQTGEVDWIRRFYKSGPPAQPDICDYLYGHASDRRQQPIAKRHPVIAGGGRCRGCRDCDRDRRDDVADDPRPHLVSG